MTAVAVVVHGAEMLDLVQLNGRLGDEIAAIGPSSQQIYQRADGAAVEQWMVLEFERPEEATAAFVTLAERSEEKWPKSFVAAGSARLLSERVLAPYDGRRATHLLPIPYSAPANEAEELDRWYEDEHTPLVLSVPGWLRVRRFAVEECAGGTWSRLLLHDLADGNVLERPQIKAGMETQWRRKLAATSWFLAEPRAIYERVQ